MRLREWSGTLANFAVIFAAVVVIARPQGPLGHWWSVRSREITRQREITATWASLVDAPRIDQGVFPVVMVVFSDYECPHCASANSALEELLASDPEIGVAYRSLPLSAIHPNADQAAVAALCADQQGRFGPMHHRLFATTEWRGGGDWVALAEAVGVGDLQRFVECLADPVTQEMIDADRRLAERLGINSTPTFLFPDGTVRWGAMTHDELLEAVAGRLHP